MKRGGHLWDSCLLQTSACSVLILHPYLSPNRFQARFKSSPCENKDDISAELVPVVGNADTKHVAYKNTSYLLYRKKGKKSLLQYYASEVPMGERFYLI